MGADEHYGCIFEANIHSISVINISPEIARILIFAIDSRLKALHWYSYQPIVRTKLVPAT